MQGRAAENGPPLSPTKRQMTNSRSLAHPAQKGKTMPEGSYRMLTEHKEKCTCGECCRYWYVTPDGELTIFDAEDGTEVTAYLPEGWGIARLGEDLDAEDLDAEVLGTNAATVIFEGGELKVVDQWWDELTVWPSDGLALVYAGVQQGVMA